ncbi:MAG TPA: DUF4157 domain-containing protein [Longimicrobium sp.]
MRALHSARRPTRPPGASAAHAAPFHLDRPRGTVQRLPDPSPATAAPSRFVHDFSGVPLRVGPANDPWERAADRTADEVMRMSGPRVRSTVADSVDRHAGGEPPLRRAPSGCAAASAAPPAVGRVLQSPGHPLDASARAFMEPRFGYDFSGVRVHTDARAGQAAASIGARAFTARRSIVFGPGEYAPETAAGRRLLSHELAHVVQQDGGAAGVIQRACVPAPQSAAAPGTVPAEVIDLLKLREGWCGAVYVDSEGYETVGMGHKLTAAEKEQYAVGDTVPVETLDAWAQADAESAYAAATSQAATIGVTDARLVNALTPVNFQLGIYWYTKHKKTWAYLQAQDWENAATEAQDSQWYSQTPTRVEDFQTALRALSGTTVAAGGAYAFKIGEPTGTGSVTASSLNVRKGPGTTYGKTGTRLQKGASVTVYGQAAGWLCIGEGQWVSAEFVTLTPTPSAPAAAQYAPAAKKLIAAYATFLPWTQVYVSLDERGLARMLNVFAGAAPGLVLAVFAQLYDVDTDDVAYEMASLATDAQLAAFDRTVLARMKRAMQGLGEDADEAAQIARIDVLLGSAAAVPAPTGSTMDSLKAQIAAGKITFDSAEEKTELLGENKTGSRVTARLQALVVHLSTLQTVRISSVVRTEGHHGSGRAVDVGNETIAGALLPAVATDATVASLGIDELIFDAREAGESDAQKWNYDQGKPHRYGSATLADHKDHIHFAVKAG